MTTENTTPAETPEGEQQAYSPEKAARSAAIFDASMALGHPKHYRTEYTSETKGPSTDASGVLGAFGATKPGETTSSTSTTVTFGRELVDVAAFITAGRVSEDETLTTAEPVVVGVEAASWGPAWEPTTSKPAECGPGCPCGREKRTPRPATTAEAAAGDDNAVRGEE